MWGRNETIGTEKISNSGGVENSYILRNKNNWQKAFLDEILLQMAYKSQMAILRLLISN